MKRLTVSHKDGEVIFVIRHNGQNTIVDSATDNILKDLTRWMVRGFSEFVGAEGDRLPRKTEPDDPVLLARIAERMRIYGFITVEDETSE